MVRKIGTEESAEEVGDLKNIWEWVIKKMAWEKPTVEMDDNKKLQGRIEL